MYDPDEHYIPEDGDPWWQQQQELEQQEAESSAISTEQTSKSKAIKPPVCHKISDTDSGDPF
jgi:hypothetical protein